MRVKNRMRVTRTSGSVRGGDGNILAYSACRLCDRPHAVILIERIKACISIGLQNAAVMAEMPLGMVATTIA